MAASDSLLKIEGQEDLARTTLVEIAVLALELHFIVGQPESLFPLVFKRNTPHCRGSRYGFIRDPCHKAHDGKQKRNDCESFGGEGIHGRIISPESTVRQ